jgi:hypothetical protein
MILIRRLLLYSHLFLAACAAALWCVTLKMSDGVVTYGPDFYLLVSSTLFYYNFHKFAYKFKSFRISEMISMMMDKSVWLFERVLFFMSGAVFLVSFLWAETDVKLCWMALAGCSLLYSLPMRWGKGKSRRLREIPALKLVDVALVWAISTVVIPLVSSNLFVVDISFWSIFISRFVLVFCLCIPFEIRDEQRERAHGFTSFMEYGRKNIFVAGTFMLLVATLLVLLAYQQNMIDQVELISYVFTHTLAFAWIVMAKPTWPDWYFKFWVDGTMLAQFIFLTIFV